MLFKNVKYFNKQHSFARRPTGYKACSTQLQFFHKRTADVRNETEKLKRYSR